MDLNTSVRTKEKEEVKKAYAPPKLVQYGDIRELTRNVGMAGMNSDGGMGNNKTS